MNTHLLKVFRAVVEAGSLTRAGEQLHLSPSTISLHIKQLESYLDCQLFLRAGKRVLLNDAGRVLWEHSERVFSELKNAEMAVRELSGTQRGTLRFGTGASTLNYLLPPVLETYRKKRPNVELMVVTGTTEILTEQVRAHALDLGLVMLPVTGHDLDVTPLFEEELLVSVSNKDPLARKRRLTVTNLAALPFILYQNKTAMQNLVDRFFAELQIAPRVVMQMENIESIKSLIGAGLGASILPEHSVDQGNRGSRIHLMRVEGHTLKRHLGLITLKSTIIPTAVREMIGMISDSLSPKPVRN